MVSQAEWEGEQGGGATTSPTAADRAGWCAEGPRGPPEVNQYSGPSDGSSTEESWHQKGDKQMREDKIIWKRRSHGQGAKARKRMLAKKAEGQAKCFYGNITSTSGKAEAYLTSLQGYSGFLGVESHLMKKGRSWMK